MRATTFRAAASRLPEAEAWFEAGRRHVRSRLPALPRGSEAYRRTFRQMRPSCFVRGNEGSPIPPTALVYSLFRSSQHQLIGHLGDARVSAMLDLHWNHILKLGSIFGALGVVASCSGSGAAVRSSSANGDDVTGNGDDTTRLAHHDRWHDQHAPEAWGCTGNGTGMGCQQLEVNFVPKTPTVFILVDRSGSMFDSMAWDPLRAGVLDVVVESSQADIRFGFGAFTGEVGQTCPMFDKVPIALNNSDAIADRLQEARQAPERRDPTAKVLTQVRDILKADSSPGDKYILFVTDGEPDYCDDPNPICPVDSVISALQALEPGGDQHVRFWSQGAEQLDLGLARCRHSPMPEPASRSRLPGHLRWTANLLRGNTVAEDGRPMKPQPSSPRCAQSETTRPQAAQPRSSSRIRRTSRI